LYLKGEAFNQVENYEQAILSFELLVKAYPKSDLVDLANMGLGWAFLNRREPDYFRAIRYFDLVIKRNLTYHFYNLTTHSLTLTTMKYILFLDVKLMIVENYISYT